MPVSVERILGGNLHHDAVEQRNDAGHVMPIRAAKISVEVGVTGSVKYATITTERMT